MQTICIIRNEWNLSVNVETVQAWIESKNSAVDPEKNLFRFDIFDISNIAMNRSFLNIINLIGNINIYLLCLEVLMGIKKMHLK